MAGAETPLQRLRRNLREQPLSYRVLGLTLLWSLLVTTLAAAWQLHAAWRSEHAEIQRRLGDIEQGYVPSLSASLWAVDRVQVDLMLDGIERLPGVAGLRLQFEDEVPLLRGRPGADGALMVRSYPLVHRAERDYELGRLEVTIGRDGVLARLRERALGIVVGEALTIFLVSLFVFALFQLRVNRHLRTMAGYARGLDASRLDRPLLLGRTRSRGHPDEIEQVADAINRMRERLLQDIEARTRAEAELGRHREHLEELVAERTRRLQEQSRELELARDRAEGALARLTAAQQQLVESEKMASLGQLVAGVAHEVNTPLGVALTASSYLELQALELARAAEAGQLGRESVLGQAATLRSSAALVQQNLERAARLVQSFKQVSVDRSADDRRVFELRAFAEGLVASLRSLWSRRRIDVRLRCPPGLQMHSYPGALGAVLTNLIQNALVHAYGEHDAGVIEIEIDPADDDHLRICVRDRGAGIAATHLAHIFEPFYTTRRGQGGTGLGLHVVYNQVTQKLGGRVEVSSSCGDGAEFRLILPRVAP